METLKFLMPPNSTHAKLIPSTFPSPLGLEAAFRLNESTVSLMETDNSSNSSPHPDYDCWSSSVSRRSSPTTTKSDREYGSRSEDDSDDDDVSVGCESPPPPNFSPATPPSPTKSPLTDASRKPLRGLGDGHQSAFLKFSIDNILRPEFGGYTRKPATTTSKTRSKRTAGAAGSPTKKGSCAVGADEAPVDLSKLSKDCANSKQPQEQQQQVKTESADSKQDGNILWPAWVYCTRYSDRPSSGECQLFLFKPWIEKHLKWQFILNNSDKIFALMIESV